MSKLYLLKEIVENIPLISSLTPIFNHALGRNFINFNCSASFACAEVSKTHYQCKRFCTYLWHYSKERTLTVASDFLLFIKLFHIQFSDETELYKTTRTTQGGYFNRAKTSTETLKGKPEPRENADIRDTFIKDYFIIADWTFPLGRTWLRLPAHRSTTRKYLN